ncbi:uncharacterized protein AC631_03093 [Debaryomyces fabryi]|uniref:Acyl-CoA thioesterase II n=1 Tax=Debaryomyces fabryi TaxID=58627 RepID=A0A0V1PY47_9ASCO|nr:uncharacterized protein AC631_03093 [Debaryomyces fabryi]KSA01152.1 hypothetical protein AC631_03093 [Debaryomyces fabryi]CUM46382.1 unnamed protein product [Debaryomyces fabryi]
MKDVEYSLGVKQISETKFQGNAPLSKPHPSSRGVYGGNLAGQALLVAIRSSPKGFTPHALHSFFVKATSPDSVVDWEVQVISQGNNFCNRLVKAIQDGEIKYIANISLTRKNSNKDATEKYLNYRKRIEEQGEEDDETHVQKPFGFGTPYPKWLKDSPPESLNLDDRSKERLIYHKITPEMVHLDKTENENEIAPSERKLSFYVKWGNDGEVEIKDPAFQYVGLGVLSDSYFLTRLARILRIPDINHFNTILYFSLSLDHIMYFHDTDFDVTQWMGFSFKNVRFANNRALLEGEMYNEKGVHVASIIQEGLVHFNGIEERAKL